MAESGPEIGATLRETRMRARIDIGEVEMRTKIRAKYLRAIENEEWDLLPGPVYVKSFLRTYAEYLGLDARALLDEYKRRYELAPDARPLSAVKRDRERERSPRRRRGFGVPSWAVILLVLIAAAAALYFIGRGHGASAPKAARGVVTVPTHTFTRPAATHTTARTPTTTIAAVRTRATLKLVPTGPVWVCVVTPAGTKLIDGVIENVGTQIPALSGSELLVRLGNANVTVTGDGKPYKLSASATAIDLKVTPKGVSALPQGPSCA
jgi:cytoskeleton protein RodZ